jgi:hypothetical protein
MIIDDAPLAIQTVPFIFRFAEPLPETRGLPMRYDAARQVAQVLVDGTWVDRTDAPDTPSAFTRFTRVEAETTDDR